MKTITVNGIDFNVEINPGFEVGITDVNGNQVAFAEVDGNNEQGIYILYDDNGEGEEHYLPREIYDDLADSDGLKTAHWLCSISF